MHPDLHTDLDNLDSVENNLRHSIKGSLDAYDVTDSLSGYEPNDTVSNELVDSQGPFSYVTPSSDQDIDDTTLGKLLTEAHREYADYRSLEGVFVSQSSLSVESDRTEKPVGKSNIDQFSFGVRKLHPGAGAWRPTSSLLTAMRISFQRLWNTASPSASSSKTRNAPCASKFLTASATTQRSAHAQTTGTADTTHTGPRLQRSRSRCKA